MNQQIHNPITFTVLVVLVSVAIIACGRKNDQEAASQLPDLPQDRIGELKPAPGSQALATSHVQRVSGPPSQLGPPPPPCAKDASQEDYTAGCGTP